MQRTPLRKENLEEILRWERVIYDERNSKELLKELPYTGESTYLMMGKRIGEFLKIIIFTSAGSERPGEETECTIEGIHESSR